MRNLYRDAWRVRFECIKTVPLTNGGVYDELVRIQRWHYDLVALLFFSFVYVRFICEVVFVNKTLLLHFYDDPDR